jgi:hypothetical protein
MKRKRQEKPKRYIEYDTDVNENGVLFALSNYNIPSTNKIPCIEIQNSILRHVNKISRDVYIEKYGIFHVNKCKFCIRAMYLYMHSRFLNCDVCSSCYRINYIKKKQCVVENKETTLDALKIQIYNVHKKDYDHEKNYLKCKNAVNIGNVGLMSLYSKFPGNKIKCKLCNENKFINNYHSERKSTKGIQTTCNDCRTLSKDCLIYKINCLLSRVKLRNIPIETSMSVVEMINIIKTRQNDLDYYTMIPLSYISGSPFSPSPEKIDRDGGYLVDNTALCFQILNVGGEHNWTRKLTLQIYFANEFIPRVIDLNKSLKLKKMYNETKGHARSRGKNKQRRKDNAGEHTLTFEECIELVTEQGWRCALSKLPLVFKSHHKWMASIDRIDPGEGYHKWNCRIVIYRLNMGSTWTVGHWEYFTRHLKMNIGLVITAEKFQDNVKRNRNLSYKLLNVDSLIED